VTVKSDLTVWVSGAGIAAHAAERCPGLADGQAKAELEGHRLHQVRAIPWATAEAMGRRPCLRCMAEASEALRQALIQPSQLRWVLVDMAGVRHESSDCDAITESTFDVPASQAPRWCELCGPGDKDWATLEARYGVGATSPEIHGDVTITYVALEETQVTCQNCSFDGVITGPLDFAGDCPACGSALAPIGPETDPW